MSKSQVFVAAANSVSNDAYIYKEIRLTGEEGATRAPQHVGAKLPGMRMMSVLTFQLGVALLFFAGVTVGQQTAAPALSGGEQLAEVIVTATKQPETLTKAPVAVSVMSASDLRQQGVTQVRDLPASIPNLQIQTVGQVNGVLISIRGISNTDYDATGNPSVATYIDGVYVSRTQGLLGAFYDLSQVEVERGPQGTLYGRNSTGGNVLINTADPVHTFAAAVDVSYGNYNDVLTHGMLNLPVTDEFAVRMAYFAHRNDGLYDTQGTTNENYGKADDIGGRVTALWTPSSNFSWRFSVDDILMNGTTSPDFTTNVAGWPIDGGDPFSRPYPSYPAPLLHINNVMARSRIDWQLSDIASLTYIAGYQNINAHISAAIPENEFNFDRHERETSISHELDFKLNVASLHNVLGASYFKGYELAGTAYDVFLFNSSRHYAGAPFVDRSWGVFDQATYDVIDTFRVIGGVRYTRENQSLDPFTLVVCNSAAIPLTSIEGMAGTPGCSASIQPGGRGQWPATTWKVGAEYDLAEHASAYFTVSTGFKSGGMNTGVGVAPTYDPEKLTNYELGLKSLLLDNKLRVNLALFDEQYKSIQETQIIPSGEGTETLNAAGAKIYGLELETDWLPTKDDHVKGFFTYLHATYENFANAVDSQTNALTDASGHYLTHAPRVSARLQYSHDFPLFGGVVSPGAAIYGQTKNYLRPQNLQIDTVPGYTKTDLTLNFADSSGHWNATAYVYNVSDKITRNNGSGQVTIYTSEYDPPRTEGIRLSYKF